MIKRKTLDGDKSKRAILPTAENIFEKYFYKKNN
jgi:hypothetical protein